MSKTYKYFPTQFQSSDFDVELQHFFTNEKTTLRVEKMETTNKEGKRPEIIMNLKIGNNQPIQVKDITNLETQMYSKNLSITHNKTVYNFIFKSLMDKFLFESLVYNTFLYSLSRDFIVSQLKLNVCIITWNTSSINLPDLTPLFRSDTLHNVDIFAIGVQECKMLQKNNWMQNFRTLAEHYGFSVIADTNLVQMIEVVFIKKELLPFVSCVETEKKGMGLGNFFGNKGAMLISFRIMGFLFVFVNCHLAPKVFKTLERNEMAQNFVKSIKIGEKFAQFDVLADFIFWFGDLNYRVDCPFQETITRLNNDNMKELRDKDQLKKQMGSNKIFSHFEEKQLEFSPTYRRTQILIDEDGNVIQKKKKKEKKEKNKDKEKNKNNDKEKFNDDGVSRYSVQVSHVINLFPAGKYDEVYNNKDDQSPSWCDRILIKTNRNYETTFYNSLKEIKYSDHLPVQCSYSVYLTLPILTNLDSKESSIKGKINYKNILLRYNIVQSDLVIKYPVTFTITSYYFVNDKPAETKSVVFEKEGQMPFDKKKDWIEIEFPDLGLNVPPKVIFDFPQMKAFNVFFICKMLNGKEETEIGYSKYSFENTEKNKNLLDHSENLVVYYNLRDMGVLSFKALYQYNS